MAEKEPSVPRSTMTIKRRGTAKWTGNLETGNGTVRTESGALDATYDTASRFEEGTMTNPEELIAASHAACYSMALTQLLTKEGFPPNSIETDATVEMDMDEGPEITRVQLSTRGSVPGIDAEDFRTYAEDAEEQCPVSGALDELDISVDATLEGEPLS